MIQPARNFRPRPVHAAAKGRGGVAVGPCSVSDHLWLWFRVSIGALTSTYTVFGRFLIIFMVQDQRKARARGSDTFAKYFKANCLCSRRFALEPVWAGEIYLGH